MEIVISITIQCKMYMDKLGLLKSRSMWETGTNNAERLKRYSRTSTRNPSDVDCDHSNGPAIDEIVKRSKDILSTSHLHTVKLRDYLNWIYTQHGSGVSIVLKVGL